MLWAVRWWSQANGSAFWDHSVSTPHRQAALFCHLAPIALTKAEVPAWDKGAEMSPTLINHGWWGATSVCYLNELSKRERASSFKACLIWTISSDNQGPGLIHLQWVGVSLLLLQQRQIMFNLQWCSNSGFICRWPLTQTKTHAKGHTAHTGRSTTTNLHPHAESCSVCSLLASSLISPPPPWNVFSNLSVMCCLEGAVVTQVQLLLSEAGFRLCAPAPCLPKSWTPRSRALATRPLEESVSQWPSSFVDKESSEITIWHTLWKGSSVWKTVLLTLINWGEMPLKMEG